MERKTHPEYDPSKDADDELKRGSGQLVDEGLVDEEKDLVADAAEQDEDQPAEEAAVRIREGEPPGATDGPDSYVGEDAES
jgi:hypothetical protein